MFIKGWSWFILLKLEKEVEKINRVLFPDNFCVTCDDYFKNLEFLKNYQTIVEICQSDRFIKGYGGKRAKNFSGNRTKERWRQEHERGKGLYNIIKEWGINLLRIIFHFKNAGIVNKCKLGESKPKFQEKGEFWGHL